MNLYDVEFKIKGNPHLQSAMPIAKNMKEVRSQFKQMAGVKIVKIEKKSVWERNTFRN